MNKDKLFDSLSGLFAYDTGSVGIGIYDELLRSEIKVYMDSLDENSFRLLFSEFIREQYLSDKALKQGYGIEDVNSFIKWLSDYMDYDI